MFALIPQPPLEAQIYSTMPSTAAHRPEMAMDGDGKTAFRSVYGMEEGDDFRVFLSRPAAVGSIRVATGDAEGDDLLTDAILETSADGTAFVKAASFDKAGVAAAKAGTIVALRIRTNRGRAASHLQIREIALGVPVAHVQQGPPRGFVDVSEAPDVAAWAARAKAQMESFWPDAAALLYSDGFVTPNAVNIVYKTGPGVTDVAAYGGGVMTVNAKWCREHPEDTALTVHEMAHVVQSGGAPGWLVEAVADYIRWVKYEPQNHHPRIDVAKATPRDPYRTGATFLGWLELNYDRKLVTKLNDDARFGRYKDELFLRYCGKDIDALWKEFVAAYQKDPATLLTPAVSPAMRPRVLPVVVAGTSRSIELAYDLAGLIDDGRKFSPVGGFDGGGAAYSSTLLGAVQNVANVAFRIAPPGAKNVLVARGQAIPLFGRHKSLWILGAAIEGGQRDQVLTVTYTDGTTQRLDQSFSDWYQPEGFPGETRAVRMPYRTMADGRRDPRPFYVYSYGFALDPSKELKSVVLPKNENVRVLAISMAV